MRQRKKKGTDRQTDRPQMTLQYGACSWHVGWLRLQTHTLNV